MKPHEKIARLNDVLRTSLGVFGGRIVMTRSIALLPEADRFEVFKALRAFDAFCEDNDPYGEHDCASFDAAGHRCMFKVDYYDQAMQYASPDPADPAVTQRVLTVMLAEDY
jgi:hypothetical protein